MSEPFWSAMVSLSSSLCLPHKRTSVDARGLPTQGIKQDQAGEILVTIAKMEPKRPMHFQLNNMPSMACSMSCSFSKRTQRFSSLAKACEISCSFYPCNKKVIFCLKLRKTLAFLTSKCLGEVFYIRFIVIFFEILWTFTVFGSLAEFFWKLPWKRGLKAGNEAGF